MVAFPLISWSSAHIVSEQASSWICHTHRSLNENFEFNTWDFFFDFSNLINMKFTSKDYSLNTHIIPELNSRIVHCCCLSTKMEVGIWHIFFEHMESPWIWEYNRISSHIRDLFYYRLKDLDIYISWEDIHRQKDFASELMNCIYGFFEFWEISELVWSHSEWGKGHPHIYFLCSESCCGNCFVVGSSRSHDHWSMHVVITLFN